MSNTTPNNESTYAKRLAHLGEERDVIASEDIYNEQGALILKKGSRINQKISERIVQFRLIKPIESCVNIDNAVSPQDLYRDLSAQLEKLPETLQIHSALKLEKPFKQHSLEIAKYPVLRQKLTVMREQMPRLYRQTLCVTWLSLAIAKQMKLSEQHTDDCFLSALAHDLGMMHINPAILSKTDSLDPAEWRQIQAHVIIAQKILEAIPDLSNRVPRIVLEHHERCDGTGYPVGKFDQNLTPESQIIALSDSVFTVFTKNIANQKHSLRDLLPFIQVNSESHFYNTYTALVKIIKKANFDESSYIDDKNIELEVARLESKNSNLSYLLSCLELIVGEISNDTEHKSLQSSRAILTQVSRIIRGSGILDDGYLRWLLQVKQEKLSFSYRETADVILMLDEIEWQLTRTIKILGNFIDEGPDSEKELKKHIQTNLPTDRRVDSPPSAEFALS